MIPPIADLGQLQGLETGMQKPVQNSATGEHGQLVMGGGKIQRWGDQRDGKTENLETTPEISRVEDHWIAYFRYFNGVLDGI